MGGAAACGPVNWIVAGPDGNLWFADDNGLVGMMTTAGVATEWDIALRAGDCSGCAEPAQMAFGPDGNLYIADFESVAGGFIDRIAIGGAAPAITRVPSPMLSSLLSLTVGPDNNIWFGDTCANIGMVPPSNFSPAGALVWGFGGESGSASPSTSLQFLASSPGGVWGTDGTGGVYRFSKLSAVSANQSPAMTPLHPFGNVYQYPFAIGLGPDGNIWVSANNYQPNAVAKIAYGAPGTGSQGIVRSLPQARRMR